MPITNTGDLKSTVLAYAKRNSLSQIDTFLQLADERIRYGTGDEMDPTYTGPVRISSMIDFTPQQLDAGDSELELPTGFLEFAETLYTLNSSGGRQEIQYIPPGAFQNTAGAQSGRPFKYTKIGNKLRFTCPADADYAIYGGWYKLERLDATDEANSLIASNPAIYLFACLLEVASYIKNGEDVANYMLRYKGAVAAALAQDKMAASAGQVLTPTLDFDIY